MAPSMADRYCVPTTVLHALLLRLPRGRPLRKIDAHQDFGGFPQLHHVDDVLAKADGEGQACHQLRPRELRQPWVVRTKADWSVNPCHKIERDEEQLVPCAEEEQGPGVVVIIPQNATDITGDQLVTPRTGDEGAVHVHIMATEVESDEELEEKGPARIGRAEITEQARRRASIGDHVQHCAEFGGLVECSCCLTVYGIEETGDNVGDSAVLWVRTHEVEGEACEENASVADEVWNEKKDVLRVGLGGGEVDGDLGVDDIDGGTSARAL